MLDGIFASLYDTTVTAPALLGASLGSLALGCLIALVYRKTTDRSGTMTVALTGLPFLISLVILLVNGNLGAGVAVAGTFSLVRFRSAPGTARDILVIFLAMTVGLACGMGYLALAVLAAIVVCGLLLVQKPHSAETADREIRVTVPENTNYSDLFSDLFQRYTVSSRLLRVKTVNMGSLYSLHYQVRLKNPKEEKTLLDEMRCRNGNLEISCGLPAQKGDTL